MTWADFHEGIKFTADIFSILTFLGLGIIGIKIGRLVRKFGKKKILERVRKFFEV